MSRLFRAALAALSLAAALGLPITPAHAAQPTKVAIIVGPVGSLTPTYLALADAAARAAEQQGAIVARAWSPHATKANVLAAVADANVIVYFGHGYGHPSPYGGLNRARQNGWGLQGPRAHGTHGDSLGGELEYVGEDWIVANARPAPGFVMIYSNTCYAPGASEGGDPAATPGVAAQRVAHYSRKVFAMGGSAYYATDFDRGAADLLTRLLGNRAAGFGSAFASDHRFVPSALTAQAHPFAAGQTIWLHRSKYTDGPPNYWYAFAGNPDLSPQLAWDRTAPTATLTSAAADHGPVAPVTLQFSEAVFGVDATSLRLVDASNEPVEATVALDAETRVATITPARPLELSARYSIVGGDGIRDAVGRAMKATTWTFTTRFDADPLVADLSVVLEGGTHELLKLAPDGSMTERRTLTVSDRRWLLADRRVRIVGRDGSWLRIADDDQRLGGWWIAESSMAHGLGLVDEALLPDRPSVSLPRGRHPLYALGPDGPEVHRRLAVAGPLEVVVDRRRVVDGRTFLHLADPEHGGGWVELAPDVVSTESGSSRLLGVEPRGALVRLVPSGASFTAFRFDADGRVTARRSVDVADLLSPALTSEESRRIGIGSYAVVASGELAGWAIPEGPQLQAVPIGLDPVPAG
ncbi:MAG: Ig-like domain-containing protein [Chloroflexi bacterium]|nr:Ig-like domain-containing protein [Chloroflexota bacterium]